MRPAWRLAISSLSGRRSRTALLVCAVALSSALIAAVACAMGSMQAGLRKRIESTVGAADIRVNRVGREALTLETFAIVEKWPEVLHAAARSVAPIALRNPGTQKDLATVGNGIMPGREGFVRATEMSQGRMPEAIDEVALDQTALKDLGAKLGDVLEVQKFGDPIVLKVVGVLKPVGIGAGVVTRPESYVTLSTLDAISEKPGKIRDIDIVLRPGTKAEEVAKRYDTTLGKGVLVRPAAKISSGLDRSQNSSRLGMTIASALAMLSAAFIIMTGLTTGVTERLRELAMVRCIGGTRWQLAESQLLIGLLIGLLGAAVGSPLGALAAYGLVRSFHEQFPGGFVFDVWGVGSGTLGAIFSGLLGAVYPALRAARTSPLEALAARSKPATTRGLLLCLVFGLVLAGVHLAIFTTTRDANAIFVADLSFGLPAFFSGYFLLAVPLLWVVTLVLGPVVSRVLFTPRGMLVRSIHATPYRFGFTSGAMAMGLALLVAIWTNGRAIDRDWLDQFKFPDAFAAGLSITEKTRDRITALPFVRGTTPITVQSFQTDAFGLKALDNAKTSFVAFEPEAFLSMASLQWIEGSPESARVRLNQGNAIIVAREFKTTRGLGVGSKLRLLHEGKGYDFDIVGVVSSPGLDIVSKYFEIGDEFLDMSVNAVFGTRDDLKRLFNNTSVRLLQIDLRNDGEFATLSDADAIKQIRKAGGGDILDAGSGRQIIAEIKMYIGASLYVFSLVAVAAMLVACFGVANLIVASIQARQYEFGVLRAIGAQPGLIARLVMGEAVLIAITACLLGTLMGVQASYAGQRMYELLLGIVMKLQVPLGPTLAGWAMLIAITLGASLPAVLALNRKKPRELLGAVRG